MSGPEHYKIAEAMLEKVRAETHPMPVVEQLVREAQVHATLALVAATALPVYKELSGREADAWVVMT